MAVPGRFSIFAHPGRPLALLLSVALHALLLAALSRLDWLAAPEPRVEPAPTVVWLDDWLPPRRQDRIAEPSDTAILEPERAAPPEIERAAPPEPERAAATVSEPKAAAPEPRVTEPEPGAAPAQAATDTAPVREDRALPSGIDWERAKQQAIANLGEQLERERAYVTFSTDDLDEAAPPEKPRPERSTFESSTSSKRSLLSPGKSRSKLGRWVSEMCNTLTGGFGFFGVGVCAEDHARSDLFALIKPEYLKKRPVCTDPGLSDPVLAAASGEMGIPTVKCRLIYTDELDLYADGLGEPGEPTPVAVGTQARE